MIESEEIWSKNFKRERRQWKFYRNAKIRNLQISQVAKFHNNAPLHLLLTVFSPAFCLALYKFTLDVILVPLYIVVISLLLSTYISSVRLGISINLSVHQSIKKIGHEASSPSASFMILCPSPSFYCIFLVAKHPLMMIIKVCLAKTPSSLKGKATGC